MVEDGVPAKGRRGGLFKRAMTNEARLRREGRSQWGLPRNKTRITGLMGNQGGADSRTDRRGVGVEQV
jgi:hypothetical protein